MVRAEGAIVRLRLLLAVLPAESVTVTARVNVPGVVGVPFSRIPVGLKVRPGTGVLVRDQV